MTFLSEIQRELQELLEHFSTQLPRWTLSFIAVFLALLILRLLRQNIIRLIRKRMKDQLLLSFIQNSLQIFNVVLGILLFLYLIGEIDIVVAAIGAAGLSAIVLGFAFKDIVENFLAGIILAFNRPFRLGDQIESNGQVGSVISMTLRDTHIKSGDGRDIYIPNAQIIKNPLSNYTIDGFMRKNIQFQIEHSDQLLQAREVATKAMNGIKGVLSSGKKPSTDLYISDQGVQMIRCRYWINTFDQAYSAGDVHSEVTYHVVSALIAAGFTLPGNTIEVTNARGEAFLIQKEEV